MRLADIGETGTIDVIARTIAERAGAAPKGSEEDGFTLIRSVGDDAAVWWSGPGTRVLTTDTMVEGVHFRTDLASWREIGWKALAVNLSDVAAMGCEPRVSVVSLGLDPDLDVEAVTELYEGMLDACDVYGGEIVGGDIVSSPYPVRHRRDGRRRVHHRWTGAGPRRRLRRRPGSGYGYARRLCGRTPAAAGRRRGP